jgi:hypothetical protein
MEGMLKISSCAGMSIDYSTKRCFYYTIKDGLANIYDTQILIMLSLPRFCFASVISRYCLREHMLARSPWGTRASRTH